MRIAFFSAHPFEKAAFERLGPSHGHEIHYLEARLTEGTASLARGCQAVCAFVVDRLGRETLERLREVGVRAILLRSAGFNHVDLAAAEDLGLPVLRVPAYSPQAVAEHAFALLLGLLRKIPQARARVREGNFSLDGLVGTTLYGKRFGIVGTGRIGASAARIARGFGCRVLACDIAPSEELAREIALEYAPLDRVCAESDIVSLHLPLTPETWHLFDERRLRSMTAGAVLVNTSRGGLVDSAALVDVLIEGHLGGAALDVYEGEDEIFFCDRSAEVIHDDVLARLLTLPNVLVTAHQAFLTEEALAAIAGTTLENASAVEGGGTLSNRVVAGTPAPPRP
jgi:D-lactate dehydrogenase